MSLATRYEVLSGQTFSAQCVGPLKKKLHKFLEGPILTDLHSFLMCILLSL